MQSLPWRVLAVLRLMLGVMTVISLGGCRACSESPTPAPAASAAARVSEPEPDGILAEIYVAHPDRAWSSFQPLLTTTLGFKPVSLSATLTDLLGIPAAYSPGVAIEKPIVGLLLDGDPPRAIVGIRMNNGGELVAALTTGQGPTHHAQPLEGGKVTLLEPQRRGAVGDLSIGVSGNALLIAAHGADLAKYGPYVARELPGVLTSDRPSSGAKVPEGSLVVVVPPHSLHDTVLKRFRRQWQDTKEAMERQLRDQQRRQNDRIPDFGEPQAVIRGGDQLVQHWFRLLADARALTVRVEPSRSSLEITVKLEAGPRGALREFVADLPQGDSRSLLRLPRGSLVAVGVQSTLQSRKVTAQETVTALGELFGSRLPPPDRRVLEEALQGLAAGRGDELSIALVRTEGGAAVAVGAAARDPEQLDAGVRGLLQALQLPAVAEPLEAFVGHPRVAIDRLKVEGIEPVATRARVVWTTPGRAVPATPTPVVWLVDGGRLHLALGPGAEAALGAHVRASVDGASSLATDDAVSAALGRVPPGAVLTLLANPETFGWSAGGTPHPLVLSLGGVDQGLLVRLEVGYPALLAAIRSLHGP